MAKSDDEMLFNHKAYKFKIRPNQEQKQIIHQTIGCSRFVFNTLLKEKFGFICFN